MSVKDSAALFAYRSLEEVYAYQSWFPEDVSEAETFIRKYSIDVYVPGQWKQFGIYSLDNSKLIGDCGFCFQSGGETEIGYTIAPSYQRRGFGSEVVTALIGYVFDQTPSHTIIAKTDPMNLASIALLTRLGFKKIAHIERSVQIRGQWEDDVVFAMPREDWTMNSNYDQTKKETS